MHDAPGQEKGGWTSGLGVFWHNRTIRVGFLLCASQVALMAILAVYHSVAPTPLPDDATPAQAWATIAPMERWVLIGSFGAFLAGAALLGAGMVRGQARPSGDA